VGVPSGEQVVPVLFVFRIELKVTPHDVGLADTAIPFEFSDEVIGMLQPKPGNSTQRAR
jgi:hypothetical protein